MILLYNMISYDTVRNKTLNFLGKKVKKKIKKGNDVTSSNSV